MSKRSFRVTMGVAWELDSGDGVADGKGAAVIEANTGTVAGSDTEAEPQAINANKKTVAPVAPIKPPGFRVNKSGLVAKSDLCWRIKAALGWRY